MSQLILSKDATIELDGKKIALKEGDAVQVNRDSSLFNVDKEFEINTEKGRMLVQPGDKIQVGGDYAVLSPSEFVSDSKRFVLEKGDSVGVVELKPPGDGVIKEGVWDEVKRGFLGQDTAAEAVAKILGQLLKLGQIIAAKAERAKKEGRDDIYTDLLRSQEMKTLSELYKLHKEGLDGERLSIGDVVDILDLEDPTELISRVRDELVRIGDKRLARRVEEMMPKGIFGKIKQVWKNVTGEKMAKGEITNRAQKGESEEKPKPNRLEQAIEAAEEKPGEEKLSVPENINQAVDEVVGKTADRWSKLLWVIMKPLFESGKIAISDGKVILHSAERGAIVNKFAEMYDAKPAVSDLQKAYKWGIKNDPFQPADEPVKSSQKTEPAK